MPQNPDSPAPGQLPIFFETVWDEIVCPPAASEGLLERARRRFCEIYWRCIFLILLRRGYPEPEAEDHTQGFLIHFLAHDGPAGADPKKGRFRDYLTGALNHYLANEHARARAARRGGHATHLSLEDFDRIEESALGSGCSQPVVFSAADCRWAMNLLERARRRLEVSYRPGDRAETFRLLQPALDFRRAEALDYPALAARLGQSEATMRSKVKRLREQYRLCIRAELRDEVGPALLEEEWESLHEILRQLGMWEMTD